MDLKRPAPFEPVRMRLRKRVRVDYETMNYRGKSIPIDPGKIRLICVREWTLDLALAVELLRTHIRASLGKYGMMPHVAEVGTAKFSEYPAGVQPDDLGEPGYVVCLGYWSGSPARNAMERDGHAVFSFCDGQSPAPQRVPTCVTSKVDSVAAMVWLATHFCLHHTDPKWDASGVLPLAVRISASQAAGACKYGLTKPQVDRMLDCVKTRPKILWFGLLDVGSSMYRDLVDAMRDVSRPASPVKAD